MPPKDTSGRGQSPRGGRGRGSGARGRGRGRGASPSVSTPPATPSGPGSATPGSRGGMQVGDRDDRPSIAVNAIGMRRPPGQAGFGTAGRVIKVVMNSYRATVPNKMIYQYAVVSDPPLLKLPIRLTYEIVEAMMKEEPLTFKTLAWFDGRAIMYATSKLPLGDSGSKEFLVPLGKPGGNNARPPKIYKVKVSRAGDINPEMLRLFIEGKYSQDETIQMAEMAINTALRTVVAKKYITNRRSFFTGDGKMSIGGGLEVRRGFFHSYRPSIRGPLINFDISTSVFYQPGPLIGLCLSFIGVNDPSRLDPKRSLTPQMRRQLQKFIPNLRLISRYAKRERMYTFRGFSAKSAADHKFLREKDGQKKTISVADYFREMNETLKFPHLVCVEVGKDVVIPIEHLEVVPGQFARIEIKPEQTSHVVTFSTKSPEERFQEIQGGFQAVAYGQSEYLRDLGITVNPTLVELNARIVIPPPVKCGPQGREGTIPVANGKWNMMKRQFVAPSRITGFIIAIFENNRFFNEQAVNSMTTGFIQAARELGMIIDNQSPVYNWFPHRPTSTQEFTKTLMGLGKAYVDKQAQLGKKESPSLLFAILPQSATDLYHGVKRFGDVTQGIATQCLLAKNAARGKPQFWANVCLKVNAKLGGINFYPQLAGNILDPANPVIVMGADAIHPPPGTHDKPSVTTVVSSVDSNLAKYVACSRVQKGRREIIADMQEMCKYLLEKRSGYQREREKNTKPPSRLIMFRDGVSEGEFQQVLDDELPLIKAACREVGIAPKITLIVVGKRHHHRGKPKDPRDGDNKSHNLPAGTTVDTEIVHPLQFDYYQWTHGGLLGTSRPGHYTILYDENKMSADALQALSFGLAHSYARTTGSVSIPAPVYYADIVCARKAIYIDQEKLASEQATQVSSRAELTVEDFKKAFSPVHPNQALKMFFM